MDVYCGKDAVQKETGEEPVHLSVEENLKCTAGS